MTLSLVSRSWRAMRSASIVAICELRLATVARRFMPSQSSVSQRCWLFASSALLSASVATDRRELLLESGDTVGAREQLVFELRNVGALDAQSLARAVQRFQVSG